MTKDEIKQAILEILTELPETAGGIINFSGSVSFNFSGSVPELPTPDPTGSEPDPTGSEPTGSEPDPTGSEPEPPEPTGSEPEPPEPTGSDPSDSLQYLHFPFLTGTPADYTSSVGDVRINDITGSYVDRSSAPVGEYVWSNQGSGRGFRLDNVDLGRKFTISMWILTYNDSGFYRGLATIGTLENVLQSKYSFLWHFNQDNDPDYWQSRIRYYIDDSIPSQVANYDENDGDWHQLAISVDMDNDTCTHYYNGDILETDSIPGSTMGEMKGSLWFFGNPLGWNPYSYFDDIQVYKTNLNDTQIKQIYDNPGTMVEV